MFGKMPFRPIRTLGRHFSFHLRGYRRTKRIAFVQSIGDPFTHDHRNRHEYHDHQSNYDQRQFGDRTSYYFHFAAVFGAYCGYVMWDNRSICRSVVCEADQLNKIKSCKKSSEGLSLQEAVNQTEELLQRLMLQHSCPGLVITVTVDGKEIWSKGYGFADVENGIRCTPSTVMRIASISKPMTMAAVAKLWQEQSLDLDRPIQEYVPSWPQKYFKGEKVTITTRQLVSMLGGVRNYDKECKDLQSNKLKATKRKEEEKKKKSKFKDAKSEEEENNSDSSRKKSSDKVKRDKRDKRENEEKERDKKEKTKEDGEICDGEKTKSREKKGKKSDADNSEFYLKKHFPSVTRSLDIFKDDNLCCQPGTEYLYSTHTWTLVSAAVEGASGKKFPNVMQELFKELGLKNTFLDEPAALIRNRARYYVVNKRGKLSNAPYVDTSYKWAGGGFLSTSGDLCRFGNAMLYSFQTPSSDSRLSFLRPDTVKMIWSPVEKTRCGWDSSGFYGMGWGVVSPEDRPPFTREQRQYFSHTGGAVGASSVLLILPKLDSDVVKSSKQLPSGVVVAIIVNMQAVGMGTLALDVAKLFERVDDDY